MDYFSLLKAGARAKAMAKQFVDILMDNSLRLNQLCPDMAACFINNCFHAIGLVEVNVQECDLIDLFEDYRWPERCVIYKYEYNALTMRTYEEFLLNICIEVVVHNDTADEDDLNPLHTFMQLLLLWDAACESLKHRSVKPFHIGPARNFDEPIARMDLQLLMGLSLISNPTNMVQYVCCKLITKCLLGLFYDQSHDYIFTQLLNVYKEHYYQFYVYSTATMDFFYAILCVAKQPKTYIKYFKQITDLIKANTNSKAHKVLTNYLITPDMFQAYYTILQDREKQVILGVMEFLDALQEKLVSVECFHQSFLEGIHGLVFRFDRTAVAKIAANLYVKIAKRLRDDEIIFKHIIGLYATTKSSPEGIENYVNVFCDAFPYMNHLEYYLPLLGKSSETFPVRLVVAHMLVVVFKRHLVNVDEDNFEVDSMLRNLPIVLDGIECSTVYGIVLRVFDAANFIWLKNNLRTFADHVEEFEAYAIEKFVSSQYLHYDVLFNLYGQILRCMAFTSNWDLLQNAAKTISDQYKLLFSTIDDDIMDGLVPLEPMQNFALYFQKVCIMLRPKILFAGISEICADLHYRLLTTDKLKNLSNMLNIPLDIYGYEALTDAVIVMADNNMHQEQVVATGTALYEKYLKFLLALEDNSNYTIHKIKTVFSSLICLIDRFPETGKGFTLKFDQRIYNLLIQTVVLAVFEGKNIITATKKHPFFNNDHPLRACESKHLMLCKFSELHMDSKFKIPGNGVWKVGCYYGLSTHSLNEELSLLLRTLLTTHSKIYKHIIPVIVSNLYKRTPRLDEKTIQRAIRAHNSFINVNVSASDACTFKIHVVLGVLDICKKSLQLLKPSSDCNRLISLTHLPIFLNDSNVKCNTGIHDIKLQIRDMQENVFTKDERKNLLYFTKYCDIFCKCNKVTETTMSTGNATEVPPRPRSATQER